MYGVHRGFTSPKLVIFVCVVLELSLSFDLVTMRYPPWLFFLGEVASCSFCFGDFVSAKICSGLLQLTNRVALLALPPRTDQLFHKSASLFALCYSLCEAIHWRVGKGRSSVPCPAFLVDSCAGHTTRFSQFVKLYSRKIIEEELVFWSSCQKTSLGLVARTPALPTIRRACS